MADNKKADTQRIDKDQEFHFKCGKGADCFTQCCGDVMIFLSPYDIVRMKNRLGLTSDEFLAKYTISPFYKELRLPVRLLKMNEDENRRCPFVSDDGCLIYEDRPWPCRMYPVTEESDTDDDGNITDYYALMRESRCMGFDSPDAAVFTVTKWFDDQGLAEYDEMDKLFREITMHKFFKVGGMLNDQKLEMYHTAAYEMDKFRDFVFKSKFLKYYEVDDAELEQMKKDDVALLRFAFKWLRFSLFGDETMTPKKAVIEEFQKGSGTAGAAEEAPKKKEDTGWFEKD